MDMQTDSSAARPFSIAVFCGSQSGKDETYKDMAADLGQRLAKSMIRLVYGGGGSGLMGTTARACHAAGGDVLGIIPDFLKDAEKALTVVNHRIVPDMHTRKIQMYEESDGFIILPGGIGTLEEAVEITSWLRLSLHQKPIVFLSHNDYWLPLLTLIRHTIVEGFTPDALAHHLHVTRDPQDAINLIQHADELPPIPMPESINAEISDF